MKGRFKWISLAIALCLLAGSVITSSPLAAVSGQTAKSKAQKHNEAAAKRLQRQREHMERQRDRLKSNRQRFKDRREALRMEVRKLKNETKKMTEEEDEGDDEEESGIWSGFFPWKSDGSFSDNLPTGLGLAAMGIIGALILIFGFLGSYLPSMGGKAEYKALMVEIEALTKRRDQLLGSRENYVRSGDDFGDERRQEATALTQDLTAVIKAKEEEARRKYREAVRLGIPIYVLMGGALAVLLATNALQALLIGFAWTSVIDRLGLKWEESERDAVKEENVAKLKGVATESDRQVAAMEAEVASLKDGISEALEAAARIKAG